MTQPTFFDEPIPNKATDTRDAAFRHVSAEERITSQVDTSGLGVRQRDVYRVIRRNPDVTNMEIARVLGWSINRVTPRVKELREKGLVEEGRRRACQVTGRTVQAWKAGVLNPRFSLNPCVRAWGYGPIGATCRTCQHLMRRCYGRRTYPKCSQRRDSHSAATDHRVGWPACGKYTRTEIKETDSHG